MSWQLLSPVASPEEQVHLLLSQGEGGEAVEWDSPRSSEPAGQGPLPLGSR